MAFSRIGYVNKADDAELTASSQLILAPISKIQNPHVGVKWQATGGTEYFVIDFGSVVALDVVRLMGLVANTVRLRYSTTDPAAGNIYDTGVQSVDQRYLTRTDVRTVNCRYVRADLTGTLIEVGRVFAGSLHQFGSVNGVNMSVGWSKKWVDPSDRKKTEGGQTRINRRPKYRIFEGTFECISESEMRGFIDDIDRINGLTDDVLFIVDPESADIEQDSIWGLMTDLTPVVQPYFDKWSKTYSIEQRL